MTDPEPIRTKRSRVGVYSFVMGVLMLLLWFSWSAMTVVPGSRAVYEQWLICTITLFLGGVFFGIAASATILRRFMQTR